MITTTYLFLDTNVFVKFIPHNKLTVLLRKLIPYKIIACTQLLNEIKRVALYPGVIKQIPSANLNSYIENLPLALTAIKLSADIFIEEEIPILVEEPATDPNDWYITNIALQYNCTVISDDNDFLNWRDPAFPILSIKEFLST